MYTTTVKIEKDCKPRVERYLKDALYLKFLHTKHRDMRDNRRQVFFADIKIDLVTIGDIINEANERLEGIRFWNRAG